MPAPDIAKEIKLSLKDLEKLAKDTVPRAVGIEVSELFKSNFDKGGFFGQPWQTPLRIPAGLPGPEHGPLLSGTNHLRSSIKYDHMPWRTIVYTIVHYAGIHNEGGEITVTKRMKGHFWGNYKEAGGYNHGNMSKEAMFWRNMALKKEGSKIRIPKRQFMGDHPEVRRKIEETIDNQLKKYINGITTRRSH